MSVFVYLFYIVLLSYYSISLCEALRTYVDLHHRNAILIQ